MSDPKNETWPKASVIIVNWNGERFLDRCLSQLQAQSVSPHEIILIDNASSDGSLDVVRNYPSVQLIAKKENLGFARANNLAIERSSSQSEWLVLLNPDAFPEPDWLEELFRAAMKHPAFDVFGSKLLNANEPELLDGTGDAYHISGLVWRTNHGASVSSCPDNACEIFSPCAAAAMYRRSAVLEVGGFDEDYFCYVEDVDLGFRLRLAGHRSFYVPSSVVRHVGSGTTGGQRSDFSVYYGHRNLVWTFFKNMPGVLFWLLLPLHVALNLVTVAIFILRGQGPIILKAKFDALKGIPAVSNKRRAIQKKRKASIGSIWQRMHKGLPPMH